MADAKLLQKLNVIADMLIEDGKPGKVLEGYTLVPAKKAKENPAIAEVYPEVTRKISGSDTPSHDFVLARQKGEQGAIAKLFSQEMPDDSAASVFAKAEKEGAKDTTGESKSVAAAAANAQAKVAK